MARCTQASLEASHKAVAGAEADVTTLRSEAAATERAISAMTMERDKLRIQLDGSVDDVERLQTTVDKLRSERADLSRQVRHEKSCRHACTVCYDFPYSGRFDVGCCC